MTTLSSRFVCAALSALSAAGLVAFADPANMPVKAHVQPAAQSIAAIIPAAHRG